MKEWYVAKEIAERLLLPAGFQLRTEERDTDSFGSYSAIYSRSSCEVRVVWDARDACAFLECRDTAIEPWRQLGMPVSEDEPWELKKSALLEWRSALATIL